MLSRKAYVYKELFAFFNNDEAIITDFLKAFYALHNSLINSFEENELKINKLISLISAIDNVIYKFNDFEKVEIKIYDAEDVIKIDNEIFFFFSLKDSVNNLTKMPHFSHFVNVFLFLIIKKISEKFVVNNYSEFEKKWKEYIFSLNVDNNIKCMYVSNYSYYNFIPRLFFLFF